MNLIELQRVNFNEIIKQLGLARGEQEDSRNLSHIFKRESIIYLFIHTSSFINDSILRSICVISLQMDPFRFRIQY